MCEVGTLMELDVKPGDVVECVETGNDMYIYPPKGDMIGTVSQIGEWHGMLPIFCRGTFRIISRAPLASDKPKRWRDMTDAEKGELSLAHHEGRVIESLLGDGEWLGLPTPRWQGHVAYRVRPEPKVEIVTINHWEVVTDVLQGHRITFNTIDGEPDCDSIKMERIK